MNKPNGLRTFFFVLALMMIVGLSVVLGSCVPDGEEDDSGRVSSYGNESQGVSGSDASVDAGSLYGSGVSEMYQDILDELDDLEDVINGLDGYTSEDLEVPTP